MSHIFSYLVVVASFILAGNGRLLAEDAVLALSAPEALMINDGVESQLNPEFDFKADLYQIQKIQVAPRVGYTSYTAETKDNIHGTSVKSQTQMSMIGLTTALPADNDLWHVGFDLELNKARSSSNTSPPSTKVVTNARYLDMSSEVFYGFAASLDAGATLESHFEETIPDASTGADKYQGKYHRLTPAGSFHSGSYEVSLVYAYTIHKQEAGYVAEVPGYLRVRGKYSVSESWTFDLKIQHNRYSEIQADAYENNYEVALGVVTKMTNAWSSGVRLNAQTGYAKATDYKSYVTQPQKKITTWFSHVITDAVNADAKIEYNKSDDLNTAIQGIESHQTSSSLGFAVGCEASI